MRCTASSFAAFFLCIMVAMHRASSGAPVSSYPGLPTCVWPPPLVW
ncbi:MULTISPECIES: ash family protein [Pseudomonas]